MIRQYTNRQLSYPDKDKFSAFSGIEHHFGRIAEDHYVAGMFRWHLVEALLWRPAVRNLPPKSSLSQPRRYICPSWSWAKLDSPVQMFWPADDPFWLIDSQEINRRMLMMTVKEVHVELHDSSNPYGRLKNCYLRVHCRLLPMQWPVNLRYNKEDQLNSLSEENNALANYDVLPGFEDVYVKNICFDGVDEFCTNQKDTFFMPVMTGWRTPNLSLIFEDRNVVLGLIMHRIISNEADFYERVGTATIYGTNMKIRTLQLHRTEITFI
jgi:hypothetical protein